MMMVKKRKNEIFSKCKAVILDMDGILVDSEPIHVDSFRRFLNNLNVSYTDEFLYGLVGHSVDSNIELINQQYLSDTPLDIAEGIEMRDGLYLEMISRTSLEPIDGIESLVLLCKKENIQLALASSSVREQVDAILNNLTKNSRQKINYKAVFEITISGDDVTHKKPSAEIYQRAITLLSTNIDKCIAIEDSHAGIMSAKASGLFCIALKNQFLGKEQMKSADYLIDSINDVVTLIKDQRD